MCYLELMNEGFGLRSARQQHQWPWQVPSGGRTHGRTDGRRNARATVARSVGLLLLE